MKIVTNFGTLMRLAKELADAKRSGDEKRIANAEQAHNEYHKLCLEADEIHIGVTIDNLQRLR